MPKSIGYLQGSPSEPCVEGSPCVVFTLGRIEVTTSGFAYYVIAVSVLLQALVFVSVGAMADYGKWRKKMLIVATLVGSAAAILMLTVVRPSLYWYAALLSVLMNIAFGTATVFYNAYLPLLAKNYHATEDIEVMVGEVEEDESMKMAKDTDDVSSLDKPFPAASTVGSEGARLRKHDNISSYISTRGFILGYLGAFLVLALSALYIYLSTQSFFNLEVCVALCGVWWLAFSIFPLLKLRTRPGPRLPPGTNYLAFSWRKVWRTLKKCRRLPMTFWYLTCFFLFSDGYSTMGSVAVIFARTEMGVPYDKLIIAVLISPFASVLGNLFFYLLQKFTRMSSKAVLVLLLCLMGLVPAWGLLGLVTTTVGLHNEWEIYLFAGFYGFLVGALQSYSRVIFSELIPPGDESEFFSLYAITDKGSSWLGPLVQSVLLNATGNSRLGLVVLLIMIWAPIPVILWVVDIPRGVQDAKTFHSDSLEDMSVVEEAALESTTGTMGTKD